MLESVRPVMGSSDKLEKLDDGGEGSMSDSGGLHLWQAAISQAAMSSSPRSGCASEDQSSIKSDDLSCIRVKLMCSYGGRILPRPHDSQLRYIGGETRIMVVDRTVTLPELMSKMRKLAGKAMLLKYQLPGEDLDALVSVRSEEDLENMMDEYDRLMQQDSSCRLRVFLFPDKQSGGSGGEMVGLPSRTPEQQFVDALNGIMIPQVPRKLQHEADHGKTWQQQQEEAQSSSRLTPPRARHSPDFRSASEVGNVELRQARMSSSAETRNRAHPNDELVGGKRIINAAAGPDLKLPENLDVYEEAGNPYTFGHHGFQVQQQGIISSSRSISPHKLPAAHIPMSGHYEVPPMAIHPSPDGNIVRHHAVRQAEQQQQQQLLRSSSQSPTRRHEDSPRAQRAVMSPSRFREAAPLVGATHQVATHNTANSRQVIDPGMAVYDPNQAHYVGAGNFCWHGGQQ